MVFPLRSCRNPSNISMGSQVNRRRNRDPSYRLPLNYRDPFETVRRRSQKCLNRLGLCQCSHYVSLPRHLFSCLDAFVYSVSARGRKFLDTCSHSRSVAVLVKHFQVSLTTTSYLSAGLNSYTISTIFAIIMPIAFKNIGWKVYIINASWDIVIVALIVGLVHIYCI